jgi:hypothetical protein
MSYWADERTLLSVRENKSIMGERLTYTRLNDMLCILRVNVARIKCAYLVMLRIASFQFSHLNRMIFFRLKDQRSVFGKRIYISNPGYSDFG